MITGIEAGAVPIGIAEAKAWLRLGGSQEDAVVAGLIRSAVDLCEAFTGQMLIARVVTEEYPVAGGPIRLAKRPVVAVEVVTGLVGDEVVALADEAWSCAIDRDGTARLRVEASDGVARLRVVYRAGLAVEANGVPEAIRHGLARMIQHLHETRGEPERSPPAIVAALWQPWRHVGIGR